MALNRIRIPIDCYMASEIDKYAMKASMENYPDTLQLGDVLNVSARNKGVYVGKKRIGPIPDFLCAGSPCQGFSKAGKGLNFGDPRSMLFFEFARILNECRKVNPKIKFFLENVDMKREWRNVITKHVGAQPIFIDSQVLCAQQRQRWYWQNFIPNGKLYEVLYPKNRGLVISDILEDGSVNEKYFLSEKMMRRLKVKSISSGTGTNKIEVVGVINEFVFKANKANKANNIDANYFKGHDNHGARSVIQVNESTESGGIQPYQQNRIYDTDGIMPALNAELLGRNNITEGRRIRRLTPIEVGRLQGIVDDYFFKDGKYIISETQVYKCCGNGWQVDTIEHLFKYLA